MNKSLLRALRRDERRMPVGIAASIGAAIARGLAYAHARRTPEGVPLQIVHRDVSPQNIVITYEGVSKIRHPHELDNLAVALSILGVSVLLEAYSFHTAWKEASHVRGNAKLSTYIRRAREPELPVVLLEDTGALLGLTFAFVAVVIASVTDNPVWDGVGTLSIGILLAIIAVILAVEMKSLLIGESATPENYRAIADAIVAIPDVDQLIHLRTQHLGPDELLVGAKVQFRTDLRIDELAAAIDAVEHRVRLVVPIARPFYVEPDIFRAATGDAIQHTDTYGDNR